MKIELKDLEKLSQIGGFTPLIYSYPEIGFSIRVNINDDDTAVLVAKHSGKERIFKSLDTVYSELVRLGFKSAEIYVLD